MSTINLIILYYRYTPNSQQIIHYPYFELTLNTFNNDKANRLLLQICTVGNNIEEHGIAMNEMAENLRGIVEHIGDIVWGLSSRDDPERCGYDINVIVGYDLPTV